MTLDNEAHKVWYDPILKELHDKFTSKYGHKKMVYDMLELEKGLKVLDAGCGPGFDIDYLLKKVGSLGEVVGVDLESDYVEFCKDKFSRRKSASFFQASLNEIPFPDNYFDRVHCERVLQYISDPNEAFGELQRVTKVDGLLVIVDTDWNTFTMNYPDQFVTDIIRYTVRNLLPNGSSGMKLSSIHERFSGLDERYPPIIEKNDCKGINVCYDNSWYYKLLYPLLEKAYDQGKLFPRILSKVSSHFDKNNFAEFGIGGFAFKYKKINDPSEIGYIPRNDF